MRYLNTFFNEKDLDFVEWTLEDNQGTVHFISNEVVIEHIKIAPRSEQEQIAQVIRKIDFANGDVNHFLQHLAGAIINQAAA